MRRTTFSLTLCTPVVFWGPHKGVLVAGNSGHWGRKLAIVRDEKTQMCDHYEQGEELALIMWGRYFRDGLYFVEVQLDAIFGYDVSKEHQLLGLKLAFSGISEELATLKEVNGRF